jgi:N-methylhydantoinase A
MREAGHAARSCTFERVLELRFRGQSHELALPEGPGVEEAFRALHGERFGWAPADGEVELVHLGSRTVVARASAEQEALPRARRAPQAAQIDQVRVLGQRRRVPVLDRALLPRGARFEGPAIVSEGTATTWVPAGWRARVVQAGHLLLDRG